MSELPSYLMTRFNTGISLIILCKISLPKKVICDFTGDCIIRALLKFQFSDTLKTPKMELDRAES